MKTSLILVAAKTAASLSRKMGRGGGGALPGLVVERLDHTAALGRHLAQQLPHGIILITGTNGKTTTTKLVAAALRAAGETVVTNASGSNLRRGILSSLIAASDRHGHIHGSIGLFEVDEASLRLVTPIVRPSHIVVLNLFRDQLDRYGELDTTAALIGQGIAATSAHLYLNADDPLVAHLGQYAQSPESVSYFGLEALPSAATTAPATVSDSDRCPVCGTRLIFSRTFYAHLGHYRCPTGDFSRPQPSVAVTGVDRLDTSGTQFTVAVESKRHFVTLPLPGTYNLYNAVAALAVTHGMKVTTETAIASLASSTAAFGRVERVDVGRQRTAILLLIKNPAGFSQVVETFLLHSQHPNVYLIINDNAADGRDISWLWDVSLETLAQTNARVTVAGIRAADMALRLKYAGLDNIKVAESVADGLSHALDATPDGETLYLLPTYTALSRVRQELGRQNGLMAVPR